MLLQISKIEVLELLLILRKNSECHLWPSYFFQNFSWKGDVGNDLKKKLYKSNSDN